MPYIAQEHREQLEKSINQLIADINAVTGHNQKLNGNINYVISTLLNKFYTLYGYDSINNAIGVLECAKLEFYRKVAAPYENQKEFENGSVYD